MSYIFFILIISCLFFIRKRIDTLYLSPSGILLLTWGGIIFLKGLLARDYFFSDEACMLFILFLFSFFLGDSLAVANNRKYNINLQQNYTPFFERNIRRILIILGILSSIGSLLYLQYFISYFGSFMSVLTAGWAARGALTEISIPIYIRAILMLGYSAIVVSIVYYIVFRKFRWFMLLPFLALLLMGIAQAGRAGMIIVLVQIFVGSYWAVVYSNKKLNKKEKSPERNFFKNAIKLISVVMALFIAGNMLREQRFEASRILGGFEVFNDYLFGGIGAFTTFLETEYQKYDYGYGYYSFSSLFDLLGIRKNELGIYTNYLRISESDVSKDTNIFTAFRQYIDDFDIIGTLFFMAFLGYISGKIYQKAKYGSIEAISIIIGIYTILFHTFLLSITVHNGILISLFLPYLIIKFSKIKWK